DRGGAGGGKWTLTIPLRSAARGTGGAGWASRILRVPEWATKTFELDELGKFVWDACDGETTVAQLIRRLAKQYNLNEREAEVATLAFLNTLARRGLIGVAAYAGKKTRIEDGG
ncbi:MAG: PqqD family protein, partial [Tepidisphaeraceae bacterium]